MTNQELFDKVATHLWTQGVRSIRDGICAYRGENGMKCAIGCLIPDSKYSPTFEGQSLPKFPGKISRAAGIAKGQIPLAKKLQEVHDDFYPESWLAKLYHAAGKLDTSVLDRWVRAGSVLSAP